MKESTNNLSNEGDVSSAIHVAIVTALPVECTAARMFINDLRDHPALGDPNHYRSGWLPSKDPNRPHRAVVALQTQDGTRNAASICTDLARSFPEARVFIMCGIAGGVPAPSGARRGMRLGDVVVATGGIVDYDHVRTVDGVDTLRRSTAGLSAALLRADHELEIAALGGEEPWRLALEAAEAKTERFRRPPEHTDPLYALALSDDDPAGQCGLELPRPWPRIFRGSIGSADRLVRDAALRDTLVGKYGIAAVEMEGSGIAISADLHERGWFMVRGIADYCDGNKNDAWHHYAALTAAAYVRSLLAECNPFGGAPRHSVVTQGGLQAVVDGLLSLQPMRDDYQRRAILAQLPDHIRTAVPDSVTGRLHIVALVQTCEHYPDGLESLLGALRLTIGTTSPEYLRIEAIIQSNWSYH